MQIITIYIHKKSDFSSGYSRLRPPSSESAVEVHFVPLQLVARSCPRLADKAKGNHDGSL
jgi:hypothetical protein